MKLRPRRNNVLIEKDVLPEDRKEGSLYLPQQHWSMHPDVIKGKVISVGEDCREVKEGMEVLLGRFAIITVEDKYILVHEQDIIAEVIK